MIESDVYNALKTLGYPIYPLTFPEGSEFPLLLYSVVTTTKEQPINKQDFIQTKKVFRVDIFAESYKDIKQIVEDACNVLKSLEARNFNIVEMYEDEVKLYREMIEFEILI